MIIENEDGDEYKPLNLGNILERRLFWENMPHDTEESIDTNAHFDLQGNFIEHLRQVIDGNTYEQ